MGGPPAWGFGETLTTLHRNNLKMLRHISQVLGLGMILWYVEKRIEIRHLVQDREGTGGGHLCGNEHTGSIKCGEFLDWLRTC